MDGWVDDGWVDDGLIVDGLIVDELSVLPMFSLSYPWSVCPALCEECILWCSLDRVNVCVCVYVCTCMYMCLCMCIYVYLGVCGQCNNVECLGPTQATVTSGLVNLILCV